MLSTGQKQTITDFWPSANIKVDKSPGTDSLYPAAPAPCVKRIGTGVNVCDMDIVHDIHLKAPCTKACNW